jgi:hypothetical protein
MGRDKASELPLLQCEAARGAAAKLPAVTTDKTANTSVNRFIGNDPTFFFRFADAPVSAPATVAPWTFVRVRSFTEKAQIAYSHGHPPLSAWVVARRREVQSEKESPRASPSRMSSLADKDGQSGPPADDAHMADRCEGVAGLTVFPDIAASYQSLQRRRCHKIAASSGPTKPTRVIPVKDGDPAAGT